MIWLPGSRGMRWRRPRPYCWGSLCTSIVDGGGLACIEVGAKKEKEKVNGGRKEGGRRSILGWRRRKGERRRRARA